MKGHVVKRSEDSYSVVVDIGRDPKSGKRKQKWYTVHGNKKAAEKFLARKVTEIEEGRYADPGPATVEHFLRRWMAEYVKTSLKRSTFESYRQMVEDHIIPGLGDVRLAKLRPDQIQRFYADLLQNGRKDAAGGLSKTSVHYVHRILHSAFRTAVKWGVLSRNLADAVEAPKRERKDIRVMSDEEAKHFLETAQGNRLYAFFLLALETGMREGELLGLRWSDIDLSRGLIRVQKTLNWKVKPPILQDVKTDGSYRVLPAGARAVAALNDFRALTQREREFFPSEYTDEWCELVFKSRYGTPIEPSNLTRTFKSLLVRAGLPTTIRIHDMRHTSATLGLNSGVDLKTVSDRLGHSGIGITADLYTHVNLSRQKDATRRIGSLLFGADDNQSEDRTQK